MDLFELLIANMNYQYKGCEREFQWPIPLHLLTSPLSSHLYQISCYGPRDRQCAGDSCDCEFPWAAMSTYSLMAHALFCIRERDYAPRARAAPPAADVTCDDCFFKTPRTAFYEMTIRLADLGGRHLEQCSHFRTGRELSSNRKAPSSNPNPERNDRCVSKLCQIKPVVVCFGETINPSALEIVTAPVTSAVGTC
ncbi:hypothetical protein EVAR_50595_1 [Eumeta japonica]|uniref:Uncharacterized protein n=1 Tax=Eumeta variegata TaxID=151549 RepID=A0A4C1YAP4_EUMVA|nr:hypothetical protein EVAR_50595_1 [Eumeta japonica]